MTLANHRAGHLLVNGPITDWELAIGVIIRWQVQVNARKTVAKRMTQIKNILAGEGTP
ncbi:MAG: hypothetical protein FD149_1674 [Rhodospirillaceae bacterium]|nr:MAG: hypothetical protein FD149_1674 [Rhodospirillaceae bacterium]